jgi:hypothetical protein
MSSKRRLRRKACDGKQQLTKEKADYLAAVHRKQRGLSVHSYKCKFCSHWHYGHRPMKVRQAIAARQRTEIC